GDAFHVPFLAHLHTVGPAPWAEQLDPAFDHAGKRIAFLVAAWIRRKSGPFGENGIGSIDSFVERGTHQPGNHTRLNGGATMGGGTNWCAMAQQTLHHIDARSCSPQVQLADRNVVYSMSLERVHQSVLQPSPPTKTREPAGKEEVGGVSSPPDIQPECCRNQRPISAASARLWSRLRAKRCA